jgi:type I restriction-modification system DNA methylase subunit
MTDIDDIIEDFESKKALEQQTGVVYTPNKIVEHMVDNIFNKYFKENMLNVSSSKCLETRNLILEKLDKIKILDPSCGSGRFLIPIANYLLKIYKSCDLDEGEYELKKKILLNNIYGVELERDAFLITKLRLISWLLSSHSNVADKNPLDIEDYNGDLFNNYIKKLEIPVNVYHSEFLLAFNEEQHFDIIIGNPPHVENKKITDLDLKEKLKEKFHAAYKLFDLSILFVEKALKLLNNGGLLSFLLPNKFLAADYGMRIRGLLINNSRITEIINISSLPVFNNTAAYPIIMTLRKGSSGEENQISMKKFNQLDEMFNSSPKESCLLPQSFIKKLPANVIPLSGDFNLINHLYSNYEPMIDVFKNLRVVYRPFGFLNWAKHFENIDREKNSDKDLLLIGTGNVGKFHIKFDKRITIAKNDIEVSYFKYNPKYKQLWSILSEEKLIFREIAKELTWVYDPGIFTNITGLYFLSIPSFDTDKLFCLLTILNSRLMNDVFNTLFSTLHMSGGYLRYNGSFIKRLPMPKLFPPSLSRLGKIVQFLEQVKYDLIGQVASDLNDNLSIKTISSYLEFFNELTNSLVKVLYLQEAPEISTRKLNLFKKMLISGEMFPDINFKFLKPRFDLPKFRLIQFEDFESEVEQIKNCYYKLKH